MSRVSRWLLAVGLVALAVPVHAERIDGQLQWHRLQSMGVPLAGVVAEVLVEQGSRVAAGAPLLRLERDALQAALQAAIATAEQAQLHYNEAKQEFERTEALYDRTLLATHDLELARIALSTANAQRLKAIAERVERQQQLRWSELRAPFAARVIAVDGWVGQAVANRLQIEPLLQIASADTMLLEVKVDQRQLLRIAPEQPLTIRIGEHRYQGRVLSLPLQSEGVGRDRGYRLQVLFSPDAEQPLFAGQEAQLDLP